MILLLGKFNFNMPVGKWTFVFAHAHTNNYEENSKIKFEPVVFSVSLLATLFTQLFSYIISKDKMKYI